MLISIFYLINCQIPVTPDYKIYPCIFLSKPGFEIGKMIDGKIIIFKDIQNTGKICLAQQVSNYGKKSFRLVKCEITKTNFGFEKDTIYDYIVSFLYGILCNNN